MKKIKVVELFAGVGGFRLGLEKNNHFEVIWSNQWEPSSKVQHASDIYVKQFGLSGHSNEDIELVPTSDIPDHDLLCGGFPCQDYSVASTLKNSKGLIGKKGVLWWSIHRILTEKKNKPKILLLENVDRLLVSPSNQRGRDFAVMLKSLDDLGYAVEWRIINAADYGMPQRRRRVFFLGYLKESELHNNLVKDSQKNWVLKSGILAKAFKNSYLGEEGYFSFNGNLVEISEKFNREGGISPFKNSGSIVNGNIYTCKTKAVYTGKKRFTLGDVLEDEKVDDEFYIDKASLPKWDYLKGSKKEKRVSSSGFEYNYSEGSMVFPDDLKKPSRTIITSEGGASPSRFRHVVKTKYGLRRLTPLELERLNMFPDNFTLHNGVSNSRRGFLMGNALVVGIVEKIASSLIKNQY